VATTAVSSATGSCVGCSSGRNAPIARRPDRIFTVEAKVECPVSGSVSCGCEPGPSPGNTFTGRVDARPPMLAIGWAAGYSTRVLPVISSFGPVLASKLAGVKVAWFPCIIWICEREWRNWQTRKT